MIGFNTTLKLNLLKIFLLLYLQYHNVRAYGHNRKRFNARFMSAKSTAMEGKIVGGIPVDIERYPSAVVVFNMESLCAGTIINSYTVISAAHCFIHNDDVDDITVHVAYRYPLLNIGLLHWFPVGAIYAVYCMICTIFTVPTLLFNTVYHYEKKSKGSTYRYDNNATIHNVMRIVLHEEYNKAMQFACDIALIFLELPISLGPRAQKAILVSHNRWMDSREHEFIVTGWGMIKYNGPLSDLGLLMAKLRYIPRKVCGRMHMLEFTPDMFCLYGNAKRDSCKGDSGGGVLWRGYLVGVVSHGDGCAGRNKPSVYTNVWYFRRWIQEEVLKHVKEYCTSNGKRRRKRDLVRCRTNEHM